MGDETKCQHQMNDGPCNQPVVADRESYTGFSHAYRLDDNGEKVDWLHWAIAKEGDGFLKCAICGKLPDDNPKHFTFGGHRFLAAVRA